MKVQIYVLNKTYIAEDLNTGLVVYAESAQSAQQQLTTLVAEYWEQKKVIVPINKETDETSSKPTVSPWSEPE
jgi:hypothetical protein